MKTILFIQYEPETANLVCNFPEAFRELPLAVQLDVVKEVHQYMEDLIPSLEASIARAFKGKHLGP